MNSKRHLTIAVLSAAMVGGFVVLGWAASAYVFNRGDAVLHAEGNPPLQQPLPAPEQSQPRLAQAAPATPSAPVRTERIVYDSWTVTCTDTLEKAAKKTCSAALQVIEEKQHQVLMIWL